MKMKKLNKGLEDLSHLFLAHSENNSGRSIAPGVRLKPALKSICLIGNSVDSPDAFLTINLSLALARLGMKIAVVDLDEQLIYLKFFLGRDLSLQELSPEELIKSGPLNLKLVALNNAVKHSLSAQNSTAEFLGLLKNLEHNLDLMFICIRGGDLSVIKQLIDAPIDEFLVMCSPDKNELLNVYKIIKMIFSHNFVAKIGLISTNIAHMYEVDAVYNYLNRIVKKYLDRELYKYGFLFKLKQQESSKAHINSFYDADLTACISNIAQIVVLRLNLPDNMHERKSFFNYILGENV
ncbi:MAG: hypothetical protein DRP78_06890 [Candidatus Omnitrophota bacterium]|nr:MAG: hypothetical protein DRP78_06890 [Candidatus Omnitrophota bacterium]